MKKRLKLSKKRLIILTSVVCTVLFFWFLIFGKIKAKELLNPFIGKIPKSKDDLAKMGESVLGTAEETAVSKFFETSEVTEPLRQAREVIIQRINETVESIKELPDREVKRIKKEVCKQWMEE